MLLGCAVGLVYIWNRIFLILILLQVTLIWLNFSSLMMINSGLLLISNLDLCCVHSSQYFFWLFPVKCLVVYWRVPLFCHVWGNFSVSESKFQDISWARWLVSFIIQSCFYWIGKIFVFTVYQTVDDNGEMLHNCFATTN